METSKFVFHYFDESNKCHTLMLLSEQGKYYIEDEFLNDDYDLVKRLYCSFDKICCAMSSFEAIVAFVKKNYKYVTK